MMSSYNYGNLPVMYCARLVLFLLIFGSVGAQAADGSSREELLVRCDITAKQDLTGRPAFFNKTGAKNTIVEKTISNLKQVDFRFGHAYKNPSISFKNGNKFGIYALALGFSPYDTIKSCSPNPNDYQAVFICRGAVPGIGVGANENGSLDCSLNAKAATEHDFCIIGFTPEFESAGAGLAKAMDSLGMCQ